MKSTTGLVFGAQVGVAATQLIIFALLGSVFGARVLGSYALTLAIATPVFLLLGLSLRVLYVTAERDWSVRWYLRCTLITAMLCGTVALLIQIAFATHLSFALAVLTVKAFDLTQMSGLGVMHRHGHLATGSLFLILNAVSSCLLAGAAALLALDAASLVWSSALGSIASAIAIWWWILFKLKLTGGHPDRLSLLIRRGIPLGLTAAMISAAINLPTYALAAAGHLAAVATYSVLSNLRTAVNMAYGTVAQIKLHDLATSVRQDDMSRFRTHVLTALGYVSVIGLAVCAVTLALGPTMIPWVFGVESDDWHLLLLYVSMGFMAAGAIYVFDAGLSACQQYRQQVWTAGIALVVTGLLILAVGDRIDVTIASLSLAIALGTAALCKAAILATVVLRKEERASSP